MLARVIGLSFIHFWFGFILIWAILQKNNVVITGDTWLTQRVSSRKLLFWSKISLFIMATLYYVFLSIPYLKDVVLMVQNDAPHVLETSVNNIRVGTGAFSVTLSLNNLPNEVSAFYFPRNTFEEGYTYKFWYLPNTRDIVKAELISTNEQQ